MRTSLLTSSTMGMLLVLGACSGGEEAPAEQIDISEESAADDLGPPPPPQGDAELTAQAPTADAPAPSTAVIEGITNKRLSFDKGSSSARVSGSITGYETVDYLLNVRSGQSLNVSMATRNTATYFNILEPGETEVAIYNGSIEGNMYEGVTARSGDYRIRIYMMRSAARRNEKADYGLEVAVN